MRLSHHHQRKGFCISLIYIKIVLDGYNDFFDFVLFPEVMQAIGGKGVNLCIAH